ncbi:MAG: cupredoxin domain-containing protein [Tepidiformaceae bacterium]
MDDRRTKPMRWRGSTIALLAMMALTGAIACGKGEAEPPASTPLSTSSAARQVDREIIVTMLDDLFEPKAITVTRGTVVRFRLPNAGRVPHNMHVASVRGIYRESPWISTPEPIAGGKSGELTWEVPTEAGVYKFRCDYHEVAMVGVVTVE